MTSITYTLSKELFATLEKATKETGLSEVQIVREALRRLLEPKSYAQFLEDVQDYHIAEKRYKEYLAGGKQGMSIEELAAKAGIDLKEL